MLKEGSMYLCNEFDSPRNDHHSMVRCTLVGRVQIGRALDVVSFESGGFRVIEILVPLKSLGCDNMMVGNLQRRYSMCVSTSI